MLSLLEDILFHLNVQMRRDGSSCVKNENGHFEGDVQAPGTFLTIVQPTITSLSRCECQRVRFRKATEKVGSNSDNRNITEEWFGILDLRDLRVQAAEATYSLS